MGDAYPVFLRLSGAPCLVVGGGSVGWRKVLGLLAGDARVTLVSPEAAPELRDLAATGRLRWVDREFEPADLDGMRLAFAATSEPAVNRQVAEAGAARGVWVNLADDPEGGEFHVPAILRRGELTVAVATGGASPTLAAWVRDRIADQLPEGLAELTDLMRRLRSAAPEAAERFRELLDAGISEDLAEGDWEAAARKVSRIIGVELPRGARSDFRRTEKR